MSDEQPFPPALPAVFQSPIGPAISYSNIRAVTSRAERTLDQLGKKVSKRLLGQINDAGMVGAMVESKVRQRLADHIAPAEQLFSDTTDLIQNQIAGNLAPAVATLEDLSLAPEVLPGGSSRAAMAVPGGGGADASQAPPLMGLSGGQASRAMPPTVRPATDTFFGPLQGENNPGLKPPGPCKMIDQATWLKWANQAQAIADECNNKGAPPGEEYVGNWWRCHEDCCYDGPVRAPNDNPAPPVAKYFDFGINGFPTCVKPAFAWFLTQWDPQGIACGGKPPVDCTVHPTDPSCPVDCMVHPEDPRCPPPPCPTQPCTIDVTCPPPVINVPPCPPLNLPTCVQIDLCDWDKFCKALKDCLVGAKEDCALDNDTAYTFKDCDGSYGEAQKDFLAGAGTTLFQPGTIDDLATAGMSLSASITPDEYGLDTPY